MDLNDQSIPREDSIVMRGRGGSDFEMWRFQIEDLLIEMEYNLRGLFFNPKTEEWEERGEPRLNEVGAKAVRTAMSSIINKISALTTLDIDEIHKEVKIFALNLNRLFFINHEKYGIKSPSDGANILWFLTLFAFNGLKQSQGALAMNSLIQMNQNIRHQYVDGNEGKGKGSGGFLNIMRGGRGD